MCKRFWKVLRIAERIKYNKEEGFEEYLFNGLFHYGIIDGVDYCVEDFKIIKSIVVSSDVNEEEFESEMIRLLKSPPNINRITSVDRHMKKLLMMISRQSETENWKDKDLLELFNVISRTYKNIIVNDYSPNYVKESYNRMIVRLSE